MLACGAGDLGRNCHEARLTPLCALERKRNLLVQIGQPTSQVRGCPVVIEEQPEVALVARRANDRGELVDAIHVGTDAHGLVDVLDKLGRVVATRKRALIEEHKHVIARGELVHIWSGGRSGGRSGEKSGGMRGREEREEREER